MNDNDALIADRTRTVAMSAIKDMALRSSRVEGAASLAWGLPSFRTPAAIRQAVARALEEDPQIGMYALPTGLPEARAAAAQEHRRRTGRDADPDHEVMITAGNMEGLNCLFQVILDPGDEVILTDPGFVSHIQQVTYHGGVPVFWKMDEPAGWQLDIEALPGLIGPRTKAIVLVTPSNPTGRILTEDVLRAAADIALAHGILIVLDDPYSHFLFANADRFFNLASVPEYAGIVAYLFTFSKTYAMSGWRAGYAVLPAVLRDQMVKIHDLTMICAPRISQVGAVAALQHGPDHLPEFCAVLGRRRRLICERLDRLAHVFQYAAPEGAYYLFPRVVANTTNSVEFCYRLLDEARVTLTPGSAFGPSGERHVRMAYCVEDDTINLAFDRLECHFGT